MYKLILVEDEEFVREAIRDIIDWEALGFKLVGEASDGEEAIEIIEKTQPDLILTDICMPFMDGLELTKHAQEIVPMAKTVVITGYDDFDYAQQALELGVVNYILKPITAKEFTKVLKKVKKQLDEEFMHLEYVEELKEEFKKNFKVLRERFLIKLIFGTVGKEEIQENLEKLNLNIWGKEYVVAALEIYNIRDVMKVFGKENKQLVYFAAHNISEEILNKYYKDGMILNIRENQLIFLFHNSDTSGTGFKNHISKIMNEIIQKLKRFLKMDICVGIGNQYSDLSNIIYSYNDALAALDYSVLVGKGKVIVKSDMEKGSSFIYRKIEDMLPKLGYKIKLGTLEEIYEELEEIFSQLKSSQITLAEFRMILLEITVTILKTFNDVDIEAKREMSLDFNSLQEIFSFSDLAEIEEYYKTLCKGFWENINKLRQDDRSLQVERACVFVKENYFKKDLSIQMICQYLALSSSYFSKIFKCKTGNTFVEYLTNTRIEKAKELLKNTALRSYEIADMIGYEDPHYFSYCFKKKTGLTPKEYRKK